MFKVSFLAPATDAQSGKVITLRRDHVQFVEHSVGGRMPNPSSEQVVAMLVSF